MDIPGLEIEIVADFADSCGEGPLWHPDENALYWTDIPRGIVRRFDAATNAVETAYEGMEVGGLTLQTDGSLALFGSGGRILSLRNGEVTTLLEGIPDEAATRFNDVIADPMGRVYGGTMPAPDRLGRLYRIEPDLSYTLVMSGIGCANGMGFTADRKRFLFTDTTTREIGHWSYDEATGTLGDSRLFVQTPAGRGMPDGLTVDAEDHVWTASWGGGDLTRYDWRKRAVGRIVLPETEAVTCPTFGGEGYRDLYVTTAVGDRREPGRMKGGALFRIRGLVVGGRPEYRSGLAL